MKQLASFGGTVPVQAGGAKRKNAILMGHEQDIVLDHPKAPSLVYKRNRQNAHSVVVAEVANTIPIKLFAL